MEEPKVEVTQTLLTNSEVALLILGKALAEHNHKWTSYERQMFDLANKDLKKAQKRFVKKHIG